MFGVASTVAVLLAVTVWADFSGYVRQRRLLRTHFCETNTNNKRDMQLANSVDEEERLEMGARGSWLLVERTCGGYWKIFVWVYVWQVTGVARWLIALRSRNGHCIQSRAFLGALSQWSTVSWTWKSGIVDDCHQIEPVARKKTNNENYYSKRMRARV